MSIKKEELDDIFHDYYTVQSHTLSDDFKKALLDWNSRHQEKVRKVTREEVIEVFTPIAKNAYLINIDLIADTVIALLNRDTCEKCGHKL